MKTIKLLGAGLIGAILGLSIALIIFTNLSKDKKPKIETITAENHTYLRVGNIITHSGGCTCLKDNPCGGGSSLNRREQPRVFDKMTGNPLKDRGREPGKK